MTHFQNQTKGEEPIATADLRSKTREGGWASTGHHLRATRLTAAHKCSREGSGQSGRAPCTDTCEWISRRVAATHTPSVPCPHRPSREPLKNMLMSFIPGAVPHIVILSWLSQATRRPLEIKASRPWGQTRRASRSIAHRDARRTSSEKSLRLVTGHNPDPQSSV